MRTPTLTLFPILFVALAAAQSGRQSTEQSESSALKPIIKIAHQDNFKTSPVLPDCYTYAIERGNPESGPSVTLSKLAAGCKVPLHIHSANAEVLFVSGTFQLTMSGQQPQTLTQGAYAYVPAKHQHQESCVDGCMYYVVREGPADVIYVDSAGKVISPQVALAAVGEHLAAPKVTSPAR
jgi:quercetin dioxygenase-like cupin family protein